MVRLSLTMLQIDTILLVLVSLLSTAHNGTDCSTLRSLIMQEDELMAALWQFEATWMLG